MKALRLAFALVIMLSAFSGGVPYPDPIEGPTCEEESDCTSSLALIGTASAQEAGTQDYTVDENGELGNKTYAVTSNTSEAFFKVLNVSEDATLTYTITEIYDDGTTIDVISSPWSVNATINDTYQEQFYGSHDWDENLTYRLTVSTTNQNLTMEDFQMGFDDYVKPDDGSTSTTDGGSTGTATIDTQPSTDGGEYYNGTHDPSPNATKATIEVQSDVSPKFDIYVYAIEADGNETLLMTHYWDFGTAVTNQTQTYEVKGLDPAADNAEDYRIVVADAEDGSLYAIDSIDVYLDFPAGSEDTDDDDSSGGGMLPPEQEKALAMIVILGGGAWLVFGGKD